MHGLQIGENCAISWNCQFLDEDFHQLDYEGKAVKNNNSIYVGNKVWIGSNVTILKGAYISSESVVAANSVVIGKFEKKGVLIAGNPAKVIKEGVTW